MTPPTVSTPLTCTGQDVALTFLAVYVACACALYTIKGMCALVYASISANVLGRSVALGAGILQAWKPNEHGAPRAADDHQWDKGQRGRTPSIVKLDYAHEEVVQRADGRRHRWIRSTM
jgi:hypothetical protein